MRLLILFLFGMIPSVMFSAAFEPESSQNSEDNSEHGSPARFTIEKCKSIKNLIGRRTSDSELGRPRIKRKVPSLDCDQLIKYKHNSNSLSPLASELSIGQLNVEEGGSPCSPYSKSGKQLKVDSSECVSSSVLTTKKRMSMMLSPFQSSSKLEIEKKKEEEEKLETERKKEEEEKQEEYQFVRFALFALGGDYSGDKGHHNIAYECYKALKEDDVSPNRIELHSDDDYLTELKNGIADLASLSPMSESSDLVSKLVNSMKEGESDYNTDKLSRLNICQKILRERAMEEFSGESRDFFNDEVYLLKNYRNAIAVIVKLFTITEKSDDDINMSELILARISDLLMRDTQKSEENLCYYRKLLFSTINHVLSEDIKKQGKETDYYKKMLLNGIGRVFFVDSEIQKVCLGAVESSFDCKIQKECLNIVASAFSGNSEKKECLSIVESAFSRDSEKKECLSVVASAFSRDSEKKECLNAIESAFPEYGKKRNVCLNIVRGAFDVTKNRRQECLDTITSAFDVNIKKRCMCLSAVEKSEFWMVDEKKEECLNTVRIAFDEVSKKRQECLDAIKSAFDGDKNQEKCFNTVKTAFDEVSEKWQECFNAIKSAFDGNEKREESWNVIKGAFDGAGEQKELLSHIETAFSRVREKRKNCLNTVESLFDSNSKKLVAWLDVVNIALYGASKKWQECLNVIESVFNGDSEKQEMCLHAIKSARDGNSKKQKECLGTIRYAFFSKNKEACLDTVKNMFSGDIDKQKGCLHAIEYAFDTNGKKRQECLNVVESAFFGDSEKQGECLNAIEIAFDEDREKQEAYLNAIKNVFYDNSKEKKECFKLFKELILQAADRVPSDGSGRMVLDVAKQVLEDRKKCLNLYEKFEFGNMRCLFYEEMRRLKFYNELLLNTDQKEDFFEEECAYYDELKLIVSKQILHRDIAEQRRKYEENVASLERMLKLLKNYRKIREPFQELVELKMIDKPNIDVNRISDKIMHFQEKYSGYEELQEVFNTSARKKEVERLKDALLAFALIEAKDRCGEIQVKEA